MRAGLLPLTVLIGCFATAGVPPGGADDKLFAGTSNQKPLNQALIDRPIVPIEKLLDRTPDGRELVELYRSARTVRDVEAANENTRAQVTNVQSVAVDVARLQAAAFKSCDGSDASQIETIARRARDFSTTLGRIDAELTRSLATTRQKVEADRPGSIRAREDVNRLVLAAHLLGRLRVQAQEIEKSLGSLGVSIRGAEASCAPTSVPPMFAERDTHLAGAPAAPSLSSPQRRVPRPATRAAPRSIW